MIRYFTICFLCSVCFSLFGQVQPIASYSFDACDFSDASGNYATGTVMGNPLCECGASFNAMEFNGQTDCAVLDDNLKALFLNDFTFSMYFFLGDNSQPTPLFSIKDTCSNRDSSFLIRYFPGNNELELTLNENIADRIAFNVVLDESTCWQHLTLSKKDNDYSFYLNGEFIQSKSIARVIHMGPGHLVQIANSSCVGITDQKFDGKIDEINFYNQALSADQVMSLDIKPDRILSNDTTIFAGNPVVIGFDGSCGNVNWSPTTNLTTSATNPVATPTQTTMYILNVNHGSCIARDTITINVVTEEDITCENILLPDAFTPNGDGLNDLYGISNQFIVESLEELSIMDRWGGILFKTNQKDIMWDGFVDGTPVNPGMFVYMVEYTCKGQLFQKVGNFSVLR